MITQSKDLEIKIQESAKVIQVVFIIGFMYFLMAIVYVGVIAPLLLHKIGKI